MKICKLIKRRMGASCAEDCLNDMKFSKCCGLDYTDDEKEGFKLMRAMRESSDKFDILNKNYYRSLPLAAKLGEENKISLTKIKEKINQLILRGSSIENPPIIGTGNSCINPCYLYNRQIMQICPKCNGKVEEELENGYTIEKVWDNKRETWKEIKKYNETKICTGFKSNNNIDKWDVNLDELFKHFDKEDPEKKAHYVINYVDPNTNQKATQEYDESYHYMMIDGERFEFPYGLTMRMFFRANESVIFPKIQRSLFILMDLEARGGVDYDGYDHQICFWYEGIRPELGQSLGYYGYSWLHKVFIYTCNSCGYKYHIIKTSPFAFRDKSKDV